MEENFTPKRDEITIEKKSSLDPQEKEWVDEGFSSHAMESVGHDGDITEFSLVAKRKEEFVGALNVRLFWGSLHIRHLFVVPGHRAQGVGKCLMEEAFKTGRAKKCRFAVVETMSFQALDFYQKLGFKIDFSREGYDRGCIFHYLSKSL
jgi:ribosomal protein S18 acetylase RimI-like enzyme